MPSNLLILGVTVFLGVSILLYCILAGADFGAGILEIFSGNRLKKEQQKMITHAMGPVWEANHVWLILAIVILFNGFPKAYSELSIFYHIPISILLVGIVLRGCAFTFRHYDAVRDRSQIYYSWIFRFSSVLCPLMLGVVAGSVFLNRLSPLNGDYWDIYVMPWLNLFSFSVGIFTCVLFTFLAAIYLIGESHSRELKTIFIHRAKILNLVAIFTGGLVFFAAEIDDLSLMRVFMTDKVSILCMALATLVLIPLWWSLKKEFIRLSRFLAVAQVALILLGFYQLQSPRLVKNLTIHSAAAPEITLQYLLYGLVGGSILIFPSLYFLLRVFKTVDMKKVP